MRQHCCHTCTLLLSGDMGRFGSCVKSGCIVATSSACATLHMQLEVIMQRYKADYIAASALPQDVKRVQEGSASKFSHAGLHTHRVPAGVGADPKPIWPTLWLAAPLQINPSPLDGPPTSC
jgi:hypothetical protein